MDSVDTYWADAAALEWQVELGADEAICDAPINRYELAQQLDKPASAAAPAIPQPSPVAEPVSVDAVAQARHLAKAAVDLDGLRAALDRFDHCEAKRAARNTVFGQGSPEARVMVVTEAPDRDCDRAGTPLAGASAVLFERMFDAIGMKLAAERPADCLYVAAPIPWRSPAQLQMQDLDMMTPFLERHIVLANPDVVVLMGNTPCQMLLGKSGVSRLRGTWAEVLGRPVLPMVHPSVLMQNPLAKREAWADLLALQAKLRGTT